MNKILIELLIINFISDFDNLTKENLAHKAIWQLDESIKSFKGINLDKSLTLSTEEKIEWLIKNNQHPYRQFAIKLKYEIDNKLTERNIIKTINEMCNGRFLDSIGIPGHSKYSDLIESLCKKLHKEMYK